jgi:hypothetical protein
MTATDTVTPFLLGVAFLLVLLILAATVATLVIVLRIRDQIRNGISVEKAPARRATPIVDR